MRILITGANGMLGTALCRELKKNKFKIYATDVNRGGDIKHLDIRDPGGLLKAIEGFRPDIVFHLAAETDVDKCEIEPEHAYLTNTIGTENVALACQKADTIMVYISTAGVFDGSKNEPYNEFDTPNPINIYGKSKWEGEKIVGSLLRKYFIFRAGWMIGGGKKDKKFVGKILNLLKTKNELSVVNDKIGTPTFVDDMAKCMISIIKTGRYGLFHMANKGICSRYDIACEIVKILGRKDIKVNPINSAAFPLPAPRSNSEAMVNLKLNLLGLNSMRTWQEALRQYLKD